MRTRATYLLTLISFAAPAVAATRRADVIVYGCTSGGITAAVTAKRMGKSVLMVCPEKHLGGLTAGGLGWTDSGNKNVIGGLSREFYHRVWQRYQDPKTWRWQKREEYGNKGQDTAAVDQNARTMWIFEPHVAENIFEEWVKQERIPVIRNAWLNRTDGVRKEGDRIVSLSTLDGQTYVGRMFIDATYEGDLMAAAGVEYHVGREPVSKYNEKWNGVQTGVLHHRHHFGVLPRPVSPYVTPGDPRSGVLPRVSAEPPGQYGEGDKKVQAYCYRMCLTKVPENRIPFPKPARYDPKDYELLLRVFNAGWRETFDKFDPIPNAKTDTNNHGPFSTDNIGRSWDYPEATYERRREILQEHVDYQQGWLYFIANDPRVPADVRNEMAKWGLAKDEFRDNGNWPHQIYVREARRMIGRYIMTENELLKKRPTPEPVGMGSYGIDSHNIQRYITPDGFVQNEGDIGVSTNGPYQISYGAMVPKKGQAANLLVSVCLSSSHIAYGSIRMEPVFMILGQSAATAAAMALDSNIAVQDLPYEKLRARLLADGQVLEYTGTTAERIAVGSPKLEADNIAAGEGPSWDPRGWLYFVGQNRISRRDANGKTEIFREPSGGANGTLIDREGRLIVCEATARRVTRLETDGTVTVLADRYEGSRFNSPNDLSVDSKGRIYFTDPRYGKRDGMEMRDVQNRLVEGVYRIDAPGQVTRILTGEVERPNGILVSPDNQFLLVADNNNNTVAGARKLWRFDLKPDGSVVPQSRKLIFDWGTARGPDGLKMDQEGRLYVAAGLNRASPPYETTDTFKAGVYILSPEGRLIEFVPIPRDEVTNCGFGGTDLRTLFITAGGSLWSVPVKTPGRITAK